VPDPDVHFGSLLVRRPFPNAGLRLLTGDVGAEGFPVSAASPEAFFGVFVGDVDVV